MMSHRFIVLSLLGAILTSLLVLASPAPSRAGAGERGDADCSGVTDGKDALDVLLTLAGQNVTPPEDCSPVGAETNDGVIGDTNCDGELGLQDVMQTLQIASEVAVAPCYAVTLANNGAVAAVIDTVGGELSTTGPDGTTFRLTIPADALTGTQLIEMTPVQSISGLPLSGGLVAAVDLQPSGLLFWTPVTLTITPATPVSLSQETAFIISHGELSLAPVLPEGGPLQISLTHFTTVGEGSGSDSDRKAIADSATSPDSSYESEIGIITHDARSDSQNHTDEMIALAEQHYTSVIQPGLIRAATDCEFAKLFYPNAQTWAKQLELVGAGEAFSEQVKSLSSTHVSNTVRCYNEASERCQNHDLKGIQDMLVFRQELAFVEAADLIDHTKADKCAHFRLEFDSQLCLSYQEGASCAFDVRFAATNLEWGGTHLSSPLAQTTLTKITATGPAGQCGTFSMTTSGSTFLVNSGGVYENQIPEPGKVPSPVSLVIQPGKPSEHWVNGCGALDVPYWYTRFCAQHADELVKHPKADSSTCTFEPDLSAGNAQFNIKGWRILGGEFWAEKTYDRPYVRRSTSTQGDVIIQGGLPCCGSEHTTLNLYHLPQ